MIKRAQPLQAFSSWGLNVIFGTWHLAAIHWQLAPVADLTSVVAVLLTSSGVMQNLPFLLLDAMLSEVTFPDADCKAVTSHLEA